MNVISETHLQMIESKVDVIVLRQKSAAANDTIASLQFKLQSMRELSFVYKNLLERFVVPRGRPMPSSPEADEYNLGDWLLLQVKRAGTVILITGGAGTGKSVVGLWLIHKLIETQQAADERTARSARQAEAGAEAAAEEGPTKVAKALPMLPFFLSLPAAEGDVFREMGLIKLLKKQYGLTNAELLEMANNYFIVLVLDSFDEIAPGNFAAADSRNVLELNNLNFFPNMSVIVTARDDFPFPRTWLTAGRLHLVETNIVPFRQEHVEQYLHLCAKSEARNTKYTERRALLQRIVARDEMRMEEIQKEKARARHLGPEGTGELTTFQSIVEASMASARAELRNYPDVVPEDEARWRRTLKTDILRQWKNAVAQVLAMLHRACQTSCRLSTVNLFGLKAPPIPPGAHLKASLWHDAKESARAARLPALAVRKHLCKAHQKPGVIFSLILCFALLVGCVCRFTCASAGMRYSDFTYGEWGTGFTSPHPPSPNVVCSKFKSARLSRGFKNAKEIPPPPMPLTPQVSRSRTEPKRPLTVLCF